MASKKIATAGDIIAIIEEAVDRGLSEVARGVKKASPYPWAETDDEQRRTFVLELMADPELTPTILIPNMEDMYQWLKTGKVPSSVVLPKPKTVIQLRNVLDDDG